jgi:hypothetical protein
MRNFDWNIYRKSLANVFFPRMILSFQSCERCGRCSGFYIRKTLLGLSWIRDWHCSRDGRMNPQAHGRQCTRQKCMDSTYHHTFVCSALSLFLSFFLSSTQIDAMWHTQTDFDKIYSYAGITQKFRRLLPRGWRFRT